MTNGGMHRVTREETINVLMTIQAAFPNFRVPDKTVAVNTWLSLLGEYGYDDVNRALKAYIRSNKSGFPPSIGQIIDQICTLESDGSENEIAAWGIVQRALRNSAYHSEEEFDKLPPVVKRVVSSSGQLKEWATMENLDGKGLNVVQSNFMRTYRTEVRREEEMRKLSPDLLLHVNLKENKEIAENPRRQLSVSEDRKTIEANAVPMPDRVKDKLMLLFHNI